MKTAQLTTALYQAIMLYRPLGINFHFNIILIQRFILNNMGIRITIPEIKEFVKDNYNQDYMQKIDIVDFELPYDEYAGLIEKQRISAGSVACSEDGKEDDFEETVIDKVDKVVKKRKSPRTTGRKK